MDVWDLFRMKCGGFEWGFGVVFQFSGSTVARLIHVFVYVSREWENAQHGSGVFDVGVWVYRDASVLLWETDHRRDLDADGRAVFDRLDRGFVSDSRNGEASGGKIRGRPI